jgi:starch synthase (maltosyl-transferring)
MPSVGDLSGRRIYIEAIYPLVDAGRFPIKRIVNEPVEVWADIFRDGHAVLAADLLWRLEGADRWLRVPMQLHENDRWSASFTPTRVGRYLYAIEAWTDVFATWRRDFLAKREAGLNVTLEMEEGRKLLARLKPRIKSYAQSVEDACRTHDMDNGLLSKELADAARKGDQSDLTRSSGCPLIADRPIARAGAWYEMMPRSQARLAGTHGTFEDCIRRLPDIAALGFDVLYLTPIHPIGRTNRKGRNNSLRAGPGDPGSPYAIGSAEGGHDAVHPELGNLARFRGPVRARSSVAERASGMVPTPSGRLHPICGKSAEKIRRYRQSGVLRARPEWRVVGVA